MTTATASSKALTERQLAELDAAALRDIEKLQADVDATAKMARTVDELRRRRYSPSVNAP